VLAGDERPHGRVLYIVAGQLGIPVDVWDVYAERDATRRSHLLELLPRLTLEQFGTKHYRSTSAWLEPTALQSRGVVLAQAVVEELRKRLIVLPPMAVIERLCAETMTRAQRKSSLSSAKDWTMSSTPSSTDSWSSVRAVRTVRSPGCECRRERLRPEPSLDISSG